MYTWNKTTFEANLIFTSAFNVLEGRLASMYLIPLLFPLHAQFCSSYSFFCNAA